MTITHFAIYSERCSWISSIKNATATLQLAVDVYGAIISIVGKCVYDEASAPHCTYQILE